MAAAIPLLILTLARRAEEKYERGEILVCEANACRRAGAQALLTEIEEKVIFDYGQIALNLVEIVQKFSEISQNVRCNQR